MPCGLTSPLDCIPGPSDTILGSLAGDAATNVASGAWESICKSFADAATELLKTFATAFVKIPPVDLASNGIRSVYAISLGIAGLVACLLVIVQVIRTVITHDGRPLATAAVGVGKAALAFMLTLIVSSTALVASDELTKYIVDNSLGGQQALSDKIAKLVSYTPGTAASLLLIIAIIGILLTLVLWFEMLLRNAAIAVLIATSPISAVGQVSDSTKSWWSKLVSSTVQLIILKPVIALVFALGFNIAGDSKDLQTTLSGMLILLLAALAWPAIARFFTFASVQVGGGAGLAALLGFAGGRLSAPGGPATGTSPDSFGQESASRTMSSFAGKGGGAAAGGAGGTGGAAASGSGAAAGPAGLIAAAGVRAAQQAVNSLAGGMEKMAGHAGVQGANPYAAQPAGYVNRHAGAPLPTAGGLLPDQPTPDWSDQQEPQAEAGPASPQADHQQALRDITPDLPVAGSPRSDPPTIEMPPVPAGSPAGASAGADSPAGPTPQGRPVPGPPLREAQPGSASSASGAAVPAQAPAAASRSASGAAPLQASRPTAGPRPERASSASGAAVPAQAPAIASRSASGAAPLQASRPTADPRPEPAPERTAPAPAPADRPGAPRAQAAPVEPPAQTTRPDHSEGGDKS
ncbi:conjugal transfer protein TrbL family protein [Kitasatospora sp. NPDC058397]|uniref:conjugal transfer protein TrbL family protein n=1 Tax=unclassified Kitasatospora TaxID=2633591 RepID=UPI00365822E9